MRELRDRMYFFVPTQESLGRLVAYRADINTLKIGSDIEVILRLGDKNAVFLQDLLIIPQPFMALVRVKDRVIILERLFYDESAMYFAVELMYPAEEVLSALEKFDCSGILCAKSITDIKSTLTDRSADIWLTALLRDLHKLFHKGIFDRIATRPICLESITNAVINTCELVGVQMHIGFSDAEDNSPMWSNHRFNWQKCIELITVFACISRLYTRKRVLNADICQCGENYRLRFIPEYFSPADEQQASLMISAYARLRYQPISRDRGIYESMPYEMELYKMETKQPFKIVRHSNK